MEDRIFPGEGVEGAGDGGKILDIPSIVPDETQKRANFCCILGGGLSLGWPLIEWDRGGGLPK